jgi:hypothetical protein
VRCLDVTVSELTARRRVTVPVSLPLGGAWARRPSYEPDPPMSGADGLPGSLREHLEPWSRSVRVTRTHIDPIT